MSFLTHGVYNLCFPAPIAMWSDCYIFLMVCLLHDILNFHDLPVHVDVYAHIVTKNQAFCIIPQMKYDKVTTEQNTT